MHGIATKLLFPSPSKGEGRVGVTLKKMGGDADEHGRYIVAQVGSC